MKAYLLFLGATLLMIGLPAVPLMGQTTILVPDDYATIQSAIDTAAAGDTVEVAAGIYDEHIAMKSGVSVEGAGAGETVLTNPDNAVAGNVTFDGVNDSSLSGFTITGADFTEDCKEWLSAVYIAGSQSVSVEECSIEGNASAGIYVENSADVSIKENVLTGNAFPSYGGAPAIYTKYSECVVEGNLIYDNGDSGIESSHARRGERYTSNIVIGSSISVKSGTVTIEGNYVSGSTNGITCSTITASRTNCYPTVRSNFVASNSRKGIMISENTFAVATNNIVVDNGEAGFYVCLNAWPIIANNTIVGNEYGLYNCGSRSGWLFVNNIVVQNSLAGIGCFGLGTGRPALDCNDVWDNGTDYSGITAAPSDISEDPLFVGMYPDPFGTIDNLDFHLEPNSPCTDVGLPGTSYTDPDGSRNDIGAYGGAGAEEYGLNIVCAPDAPAGAPLQPFIAILHNLSGTNLVAHVEVKIVDSAGAVVWSFVSAATTVTASDRFTLVAIAMPVLAPGDYEGTASMFDAASGTTIAEDSFDFSVM